MEGFYRNKFYLKNLVEEYFPLFICIQEHWMANHEASDAFQHAFQEYNFHVTSADMFMEPEDVIFQSGPIWHGSAIGWLKNVDRFISTIPIVSERFCGISYKNYETKTKILSYSVYLPTSGQDDDFLEVLSLLHYDISQNMSEDCVLILGIDSNCSKKSSKRRFLEMEKFLKDLSLKSILLTTEPTFHHNNGTSESQIDNIYNFVPNNSQVKICLQKHICQQHEPSNLSSHDVIIGEIFFPRGNESKSESSFSDTYTDFPRKRIKWDKGNILCYQEQTSKVLEDAFATFHQPENIPILSEIFSKTLVKCAEMNFEPVKTNKKCQPFFSKELRKAHNNHKINFRKWRKAGRPNNKEDPTKIALAVSRKHIQNTTRHEKSEKIRKLSEELMITHSSDISEVCSKLKHMRGDNKKIPNIPYIETLCGTFSGDNVLEGFRANTELLCNENILTEQNDFYKMCQVDNEIIFEITKSENIIPQMKLSDLYDILFKRLKLNKACDIFHLTVEHLRYAGEQTLLLLLKLINKIINNVNYLSSTELNTSLATIVHKGKQKSLYHHKSFRLVRVSPLTGRIFDEFVRPQFLQQTRPLNNPNQYGYTEGINYLLGALQRHEVEMFCVDNKRTLFTCTLDGVSAFDVVDRVIQVRELYCSAGERGDYWQATASEYKNTKTKIKYKGKLSSDLSETLGCRQGNLKSGDHYKFYVSPTLETLDSSRLGVWMGPINCPVSCVADDVLVMSDSQNKLQSLLDLAGQCGQMYKIQYGASKTKITVTGSASDQKYYEDVKPWTMDGEQVEVVEDNEHLGQIISGTRQVEKNVDDRIGKGRKSLYSLLGPAFAYKCLLSPPVKLHLYRTFIRPIILSGLASFAIRPNQIEPLAVFTRKVIKSVLQVNKTASTSGIHFLCGELPIEGWLHRNTYSLFYSLWSNPDTRIHDIVKYLLQSVCDNSRTWSQHLKNLSHMYGIDDPSQCLSRDPPSRSQFKEYIETKITSFHENELRTSAKNSSSLKYFNVSLLGLRGRPHPILCNVTHSVEVMKMRVHVKFLIGNYFTYQMKSQQSGGSPQCRLCLSGNEEDYIHLLVQCYSLKTIRDTFLSDLSLLCKKTRNNIELNEFIFCDKTMTQFIIDPSSFNLINRIHMDDPCLPEAFKLCRNYCFLIDKNRRKILNQQAQPN